MTKGVCVIFDLDGTLIDLNQSEQELEQLRSEIILALSAVEIVPPTTSIFGMLEFARQHSLPCRSEVEHLLDQAELGWCQQARPLIEHTDIELCRRKLADPEVFAIVTNNGASCLDNLFARFSLLRQSFNRSEAITRDDSIALKPHLEPFLRLQERVRRGGNPDRFGTVYAIGDSQSDVEFLESISRHTGWQGFFVPASNQAQQQLAETFSEAVGTVIEVLPTFFKWIGKHR